MKPTNCLMEWMEDGHKAHAEWSKPEDRGFWERIHKADMERMANDERRHHPGVFDS